MRNHAGQNAYNDNVGEVDDSGLLHAGFSRQFPKTASGQSDLVEFAQFTRENLQGAQTQKAPPDAPNFRFSQRFTVEIE